MCGNDLLKKGELDNNNQTKSINFEDSRGDVIGVGVSGSGHIIGKNMVIGSGTINPNEKSASKNP